MRPKALGVQGFPEEKLVRQVELLRELFTPRRL